jgi:hypothetical protein
MTCPWPSKVVPTGSPIGYCRMLDKIQPLQHETVCYSLLKQSGVWRGCARRKFVRFFVPPTRQTGIFGTFRLLKNQ